MDYNSDSSDGFDWKSNATSSAAFQFTKEKDSDSEPEPDGSNWENTGGRCSAAGPSEHQYGGYSGEASSSAAGPSSQLISWFVNMGFSREMVLRSIDLNGEENHDAIVETLFAFQNMEESPSQSEFHAYEQDNSSSDVSSSEGLRDFLENFSDEDSSENEQHQIDIQLQKPKKNKRPCDHRKSVTRNQMKGFGVPGELCVQSRWIPDEAIGPPYFYYENVSKAPKEVWPEISRNLYDIPPEFVDSVYFSAAARKRGYVHNLPIIDRFQIQPIPAQTIAEAFPMTKRWCPLWDTRIKFNCLVTRKTSSTFTEDIYKALEKSNNHPSSEVVQHIREKCSRGNLVWIRKNTAVPLEAHDIEKLLGYPVNHTRGIGSSERFERLGNSFQIDTVGYHLSVLKKMYPDGMNVLSLFSGIGGAEVALDRLGIRLNNVVSVEILKSCQKVLRNWWESTNQSGNLIQIRNVKELNNTRLETLIRDLGGFDLVIGGSPCDNLCGNNRKTRVGLDGDKSSLFYDYVSILKQIRTIMAGTSRVRN